jgi:hypothetical protein
VSVEPPGAVSVQRPTQESWPKFWPARRPVNVTVKVTSFGVRVSVTEKSLKC